MSAITFGKWLKHERETWGLTQAELARQLNCATITLRKFEGDERRPARETVQRLAEVFELKPEQRAAFFKFARNGTLPDFFSNEPHARQFRTRVSNLPLTAAPFFGRDAELETLSGLLQNKSVRVLTLTGTGGIGKTRLALETGDALRQKFRDGIFFIDFAAFTDAALVPAVIAHALNIRAREGDSIRAAIQDFLRAKQLLLVLDNMEQLLSNHQAHVAGSFVNDLVHTSRRVKILITSRQPLHLADEHVFDVPSLDAPDPQHLPALQDFSNYPAASLFLAHARAARAEFALTQDNARFVARICSQLEGIPLALELAAARVRYFPVQEIAARLEQRLRLLKMDSPDVPPRHQTLTATLDWSYELLSDAERALFARLSVFNGGFAARAAEQVCADASLAEREVLHLLTQLADKSLLQVNFGPDVARFRMLETLREYAREKLCHTRREKFFRGAHLDYFFARVQDIPRDSRDAHLVEIERDNVRAAFDWAIATKQFTKGLQMVGALWHAWSNTVHVNQYIPFFKLEAARMDALYRAARAPRKKMRVRAKLDIAYALRCLGISAFLDAEYVTTEKFFDLSLAYYRECGDALGVNNLRNDLGELARIQGDSARAVEMFEQNMPLAYQVGGEKLGVALHNLAQIEMQRGNFARANALFAEGMNINLSAQTDWRVIEFLAGFAELASARGDMERAAILAGAVETLLPIQDMDLTPADRAAFDAYADAARRQLGDARYASLVAQGSKLSLQQAAEFALE